MKKKKLFKRIISIIASLVLVFSSMGFVYGLEDQSQPGYQIAENTDYPDSDANYQVTFTYQSDVALDSVSLVGGFQFYSVDQIQPYLDGETITAYNAYQYQDGMFPTGYDVTTVGQNLSYPMTEVSEGLWTVTLPVPAGEWFYAYDITSSDTTTRVLDPTNLPLANGDSDRSLMFVGNSSEALDGQEWIFPRTDGQTGTTEYVSYQAVDGSMQPLGIYLPYGYNENETYKTFYLSHGGGGNEVEWHEIGAADNIMDNLIAAGEVDANTIVVTMDNTYFRWNYTDIKDNLMNNIIPYIEANYNVSTDPDDRAFAGFSMGAMTTTYMAFHHADSFGYFGIFSGCNIGNATFADGFEYDSSRFYDDDAAEYLQEVYENIVASDDLLNSVVFTMAGDADTAVFANGFGYYGAYETIRDWCAMYMTEDNFIDGGLVHGSHDIYTWGQCLYTFAKDVCWSKDREPVTPEDPGDIDTPDNPGDQNNPDTPNTPDVPDTPTTPSQPGQSGQVSVATGTTTGNQSAVKTGDDVNYPLYATMAGIAIVGILVSLKKKKVF